MPPRPRASRPKVWRQIVSPVPLAIRIILIGVTLILVLRFRPRGLMPEERFRME